MKYNVCDLQQDFKHLLFKFELNWKYKEHFEGPLPSVSVDGGLLGDGQDADGDGDGVCVTVVRSVEVCHVNVDAEVITETQRLLRSHCVCMSCARVRQLAKRRCTLLQLK